jgi:hypothetical protein
MPTYYRRDDDVQNGLGYAIPNIAVTYYVQPGLTLATIYNDANGDEVIANPQYTNGLGQAAAYMAAGQYTVTYSGAQIQTETFPDQDVGGSGGGNTVVPFAGIPSGTQDGVNRVFTLTNAGTPLSSAPTQQDVWCNFPLVENVGYTISGTTIVYTTAPATTDTLWAQGLTIS